MMIMIICLYGWEAMIIISLMKISMKYILSRVVVSPRSIIISLSHSIGDLGGWWLLFSFTLEIYFAYSPVGECFRSYNKEYQQIYYNIRE